MLRPELVQILTESGYLSKTWCGGFATAESQQEEFKQSDVPEAPERQTSFDFTPQRIHLHKDHEWFEDGDIHRHLYNQNLCIWETDDKPKLSVSEFGCHISGCSQVFSSVNEYEHHYNSLHRHICCSCHRALPSARLLDIHIQEWHDPLFSILTQRQDMYQCLVGGCGQKFRTRVQRKDHLVRIHRYPSDFRFDKAIKDKSNISNRAREIQRRSHPLEDTTVEGMELVCESGELCDGVSDQPQEEVMELHMTQGAGTAEGSDSSDSAGVEMHIELSGPGRDTTNTNNERPKPRYSSRVPATVCFGQGSVRGFHGRRRRK